MRQYKKVYLEITNRCNLQCSFCPGTRRTPRMLTPAEFRFLAERLRPATRYLYLHLMGAPLLHPDLPELLSIAAGLDFTEMCIRDRYTGIGGVAQLVRAPASHAGGPRFEPCLLYTSRCV